MSGHDIIVVGASAGGVEALSQLVSHLPPDLPAAIFVVLHIPAQGTSILPRILNRAIQKRHKEAFLQAIHPQDGEAIQHGQIYVAPPDRHLIVKDGCIRLAHGPKENSHRPAVDPLFRSAARVYGPRVVGVVLSGSLDDGTAGLVAIKKRGGVAIVQNPDEAMYSGMPRSAIENVDVDQILPVTDIASILLELAHKPVSAASVEDVSKDMEMETDTAEMELTAMQNLERPGKPSGFACPECAGVLWELGEEGIIRFRCRTGHAFSTGSLLAEQGEALETALWTALRALEEKAALVQRLGRQARNRSQIISARRFEEQGEVAQQRAALVRQLLLKDEGNGQVSTVDSQGVGAQASLSSEERGIPSSRSASPNPPDPLAIRVVALYAPTQRLNALIQVLSTLDADFPAAIIVVQHAGDRNSHITNNRPKISLTVKQAKSGDVLSPGTVHIAPPNHHLLVNPDGTLSLFLSELVHFTRPSADLLFESVAGSYKQRAIAVILAGTGNDCVMGVRAIEEMGGTVIVQERNSEFLGMPEVANGMESVDWVVPLDEIAVTLTNLVREDGIQER